MPPPQPKATRGASPQGKLLDSVLCASGAIVQIIEVMRHAADQCLVMADRQADPHALRNMAATLSRTATQGHDLAVRLADDAGCY